MNTCKLSLLVFGGPALLFLSPVALAQPDPAQAPIGQNPPNQIPGGQGGRGGNRGQGGRGGFAGNLTAAQRQQLEAQNRRWREMQTRQTLIMAGVLDAPTQTTLVAFLGQEEAARQKLRDKWDALLKAVSDNATTDAQIAGLLNDFRAAVDEERARREAARTALDTKLGLATNPRLDAQLMTSGLLGDEASFVEGGNQPGGRGGPGGFGGPGGGFGLGF